MFPRAKGWKARMMKTSRKMALKDLETMRKDHGVMRMRKTPSNTRRARQRVQNRRRDPQNAACLKETRMD